MPFGALGRHPSAYIDINAWEAGMVERSEGYRWCSFAAAVRGDRKARAGYAFMYGGGGWRVIRERHEQSPAPVSGKTTRDITITNASSEVTENRTEAFIDGSILSPETA